MLMKNRIKRKKLNNYEYNLDSDVKKKHYQFMLKIIVLHSLVLEKIKYNRNTRIQ